MGLLGEIYNVFGLVYSSVLAAREHKHFSRADWALLGASITFVGLLFIIQLIQIPWGYKCTFLWKSILRGIASPFLWLFYYHVLFYSRGWVKRALTFSNEAYDGVETTRQQKKFKLGDASSPGYKSATNNLLKWEGKWGYDRRVGELWVRVRFQNLDIANDTVHRLELRTSDDGTTEFRAYNRADGLLENPGIAPNDNRASSRQELQEGWKVTGLECLPCGKREDSERVFAGPANAQQPYTVSIIRRRKICGTRKRMCCPGWKWNLKCTVVRNWTLAKIHQYMLCLDAWGSNPKQGIWQNDKQTCCSGCTFCCNTGPTEQLFQYCYRHDELIEEIGNGRRLTQEESDGTCYTVV